MMPHQLPRSSSAAPTTPGSRAVELRHRVEEVREAAQAVVQRRAAPRRNVALVWPADTMTPASASLRIICGRGHLRRERHQRASAAAAR